MLIGKKTIHHTVAVVEVEPAAAPPSAAL